MQRFVATLTRHRIGLFVAVLVLTGLAWPAAHRLQFDQSIESLYSAHDPYLGDYLESKRLFGGDEFVFVAYRDPHLFASDTELSSESAKRLRELAEGLSRVPGVNPNSTQNLAEALQFPSRRRDVLQLVEGVLVGRDRETTAVVLRLIPQQETEVPRGETIRRIRDIARHFEESRVQSPESRVQKGELGSRRADSTGDPSSRSGLSSLDSGLSVYVAGEPVQVHEMFRYVEEDGRLLFRVSLALLAAVLFILFRRLQWVVLPLVVVVASILWTEAILVLSHMRLSMVSSMLNSLVTIIGIATVTHVTVHYRDKRQTLDRLEALKQTLTELLPAIFWTCGTTAIGFAALLSSHITPVRSFGTMMSLATLLVLAAAAFALPGGILFPRSTDPQATLGERRLVGGLLWITDRVDRHPGRLAAVSLVAGLLAACGFFRLSVETDFTKNFREDSPIVRSINFIEANLGGAGTWEVNFPAPQELTPEYLDRVRSLTRRLRQEMAQQSGSSLTKVVSITDGLDLVPEIPFILNTIDKRLNVLNRSQPEYTATLYNRPAGRMRILLRARERQPSESKLRLIGRVESLAREEFPDAKATGLYVLLAFLIESLLRDQLVSLALAAVGIAAMMSVAFKSVRIGLISLVPNLFPIVLVIGVMGWIGLPINIATAMIASVSMGLTVDSSIHYIAGYARSRRQGLSVIDSLRETHRNVGRALIFANLALIVGFSVLTLSHFIPLIYFGILVSVAMLGGLLGNLVLLPLLLRRLEKG